jgi:DNA repair and recombination RAD54-like protein
MNVCSKPGVTGKATCSRPLILCPSSLVMNWGNELKRWLGAEHVDPVAMDDTRGAVVQVGLRGCGAVME